MNELDLIKELGINNNREVRNKQIYTISECNLSASELLGEIENE